MIAIFRVFVFLVAGNLVATVSLAQPGGPPSSVVVSKVVETTQSASKSFVGTLVPIRKSTIGSAVDGRVTQMFVDEGDPVRMLEGQYDVDGSVLGQPLVQLRTVSLDIEIEAAEVELRTRQQAEKELQQTLPTEIESAEAAVEEIKARLQYSKENYERLLELSKTGGGIPRREIDEAYSTFSSQSQLSLVASTRLKQLQTTRETRLLQARSKVEAQEAELRRLKELKEKYTIRAPFAGYVTAKNTELGEWVSRGDQVMEIVQLDPVELMINVPQAYIGHLQTSLDRSRTDQKKYTAQVSVESVPQLLEGEVIQIVPQADLRSRSFPVKIRIANPPTEFGHLLKSGMLARASLFLGSEDEIMLVKKDALVLGGPSISLYVVGQDPTGENSMVRPVSVEVGASIGDWIQVIGAISPGDKVVVEGNERLRPGQVVIVTKELTDSLPTDPSEPPTESRTNGN